MTKDEFLNAFKKIIGGVAEPQDFEKVSKQMVKTILRELPDLKIKSLMYRVGVILQEQSRLQKEE